MNNPPSSSSRREIGGALLTLVTAMLALPAVQPHLAAAEGPRVVLTQTNPNGSARFKDRIDQRITCDFRDEPFYAVIDALRRSVGVNIVIMPTIRASAVTLRCKDARAEDVFLWMAQLVDAQIDVRDDAVLFASRNVEDHLHLKLYDLSRWDDDDRIAFIALATEILKRNRGLDDLILQVSGHSLMAQLTLPHHERLASLWAACRTSEDTGIAPPDWVTRVRATLAKEIAVDFRDRGLREALDLIGEASGLTMVIHPQVVAEVTTSFTVQLDAIPTKDVLASICRQADISYRMQRESLFFCPQGTPPAAERLAVYRLENGKEERQTDEAILMLAKHAQYRDLPREQRPFLGQWKDVLVAAGDEEFHLALATTMRRIRSDPAAAGRE